jgi:hypothetical protein
MKSTTENSAVRLFLIGVGRVAPRLDGAMRTIKHQAISGGSASSSACEMEADSPSLASVCGPDQLICENRNKIDL